MDSEILPRAPRSLHRQIVATLAPFYLGAIMSYFFWGIQVTQTYYYYRTYRKTDRLWVKLAVTTVFIIDAAQSIVMSGGCWRYLVDLWGDPLMPIKEARYGPDLSDLMDRLASACVQCFYAQKIWVLYAGSHRYILVSVIALLVVTQLVVGIGIAAFLFTVHVNLLGFGRAKIWSIVGNTAAAVTDTIIVVLMTIKLNQKRTGFKSTDDIISKIIQVVLETGFATAVVQLVLLGTFVGWLHESYFVVPLVVAPKIYSNSMLAVLNSRPVKSGAEVHDSRINRTLDIHTVQTVEVASDYVPKDVPLYELQNMPSTVHDQQKGMRFDSV